MAKPEKKDPREVDLANPNSTAGTAATITDDAGVALIVEETGAGPTPARVTVHNGGNGAKASITWSPTRAQLLEAAAHMVDADVAATPGGSIDDGRDHAASALHDVVGEIDAAKDDPAVAAFRESQLHADGVDDPVSWSALSNEDTRDRVGRRTWRRRWNAAVAVIRP